MWDLRPVSNTEITNETRTPRVRVISQHDAAVKPANATSCLIKEQQPCLLDKSLCPSDQQTVYSPAGEVAAWLFIRTLIDAELDSLKDCYLWHEQICVDNISALPLESAGNTIEPSLENIGLVDDAGNASVRAKAMLAWLDALVDAQVEHKPAEPGVCCAMSTLLCAYQSSLQTNDNHSPVELEQLASRFMSDLPTDPAALNDVYNQLQDQCRIQLDTYAQLWHETNHSELIGHLVTKQLDEYYLVGVDELMLTQNDGDKVDYSSENYALLQQRIVDLLST